MPPPVILLVVLTIGYPLVQILAIGVRRRKRLSFNAVSAELLADPELGYYDRDAVRRLGEASRGGFGTLKTLSSVPMIAFRSAFAVDTDVPPAKSRNQRTERIEWLREQSIGLALATHPIGTAIIVPIACLAWALGAAVVVLKGAAKPPFPSIHKVIRAATSPENAPLTGRAS